MTNNSPEQPDFFPVRREDNQVSLSIPSEAFEHFMLSLLGKPEIIEGYVEGAFETDFGSVQQLLYSCI